MDEPQPKTTAHTANMRLVKRLMFIVVGMFIFAVGIMPPMYDLICDITGLNGKTRNEAAETLDARAIQQDRTVIVQFVADTAPDMPWAFKPNIKRLEIHPGQIYHVDFHVNNPEQYAIVGQAIPSVAPAVATPHFKKTECFCFNQQRLEANAGMDMPLIFYVDPKLPRSVTEITLSYQLYNITEQFGQSSTEAQPPII